MHVEGICRPQAEYVVSAHARTLGEALRQVGKRQARHYHTLGLARGSTGIQDHRRIPRAGMNRSKAASARIGGKAVFYIRRAHHAGLGVFGKIQVLDQVIRALQGPTRRHHRLCTAILQHEAYALVGQRLLHGNISGTQGKHGECPEHAPVRTLGQAQHRISRTHPAGRKRIGHGTDTRGTLRVGELRIPI